MAVQKLTPRYLNKDNDERLIKPSEMTDAVNVRISSDKDSDALVLKNAYGNTAVDLNASMPAGDNKVIGSVSDEQLGVIFYFVWNSNGDHSIYQYNANANKSYRVIKDSVLDFTEFGFVKGNVYINNNQDVLLYFTDGRTAPKKINVSKALTNGYPQLLTGTDDEKLAVLSVVKRPPLDPPAYELVNNSAIKDNRINDKVFQFAYKYVYEDGEHSAISPYSTLTVSAPQLKDAFSTAGQLNFFNEVKVYVKNSAYDVEKIVVYAREGNDGTFYEIDEIKNGTPGGVSTVRFSNDVLGSALSSNDQNKLYDNVPQKADSQEILNGRLMYGGYTEGYPNIDMDTDLLANYHDTEEVWNVTASYDAGGQLEFDWSALPSTFSNNAVLYVNMSYGAKYITIDTPGNIFNNLELPGGDYVSHLKRDGSDVRSIEMTVIKDGLKNRINGINIRKIIPITAGQTSAAVIQAFRTATQGNRIQALLSPLPANDSVRVIKTGGSTLWTEESADFNGRADIELNWQTQNTLHLEFKKVDLFINSLYVDGDQRDIVSYDTITLDFDAESYGVLWQDEGVSISSFFASESVFGNRAFKSGSSHKLGVVYYDEANRSGGVQELGSVYIDKLSSRSSENGLYGRSSVVMRINNEAPVWAKRWAPVYVGKGNTELKLMYGVQGAFIPFRKEESLSTFSSSNVLYLSLSKLFDSDNSYVKGDGANISYTYEKGDKLRIVRYGDGERISEEFEVVDFVTLGNNDDNPILNEISEGSIASTTGSFVVVKENYDAVDFRRSRVIKNTSAWFDKCVVEIVKDRKNADGEIYYEIGKSYACTNGVHSDDRTAVSTSVSTMSVVSGSVVKFDSSNKLFKGDVIVNGGVTVTVGNVYEKDGAYECYGVTNSTIATGTFSVTNSDAVVQLEHGDVYWRLRTLYVESEQPDDNQYIDWNRQNVVVDYIEDYSVSDFFTSNSTSIGRPIAYIPDAKTVKRTGAITYSDFDAEDSLKLNLSSFNLSLANFKDFAYEHGSIKYLVGYNDVLYFLQEKRCGRVGVGRQVLQAGSGDNIVSLSTDVLGNEQYYVGEYGIGTHPESVAFRDGMVYFADVNAKKVLRIDSQGLTAISDVGMDTYFKDKLSQISKYQTNLVGGGIDTDSDGYLIHSSAFQLGTISVAGNTYEANVSGSTVMLPVVYNPSAIFKFNTEQRTFDTICDMFDQSVEAVVYLDQIGSGGVVYTSLPYQSSTILGVATDTNYSFFSMILVNSYIPGFIAYTSFCDSDSDITISEDGAVTDSFNAEYSTSDRVWTTTYSFDPERVDSVHAHMYSFKNGKIYKHSSDVDRNTWYGEATEASVIEVISNEAPSAIKTFESLSIESTKPWSVTVSTRTQSAVVNSASLVEKESFYYGYIHGATSSYGSTITSVSSTSEFFSLGSASAASTGATVTFNTDLSYVAMPLGSVSTLYKVNGSQLDSQSVYPVSVSGNSVTFSGNVAVLTGNEFVVVANSSVEGDQIRDYYAKLRLTTTTSEPLELFAVNSVFADSKAHN